MIVVAQTAAVPFGKRIAASVACLAAFGHNPSEAAVPAVAGDVVVAAAASCETVAAFADYSEIGRSHGYQHSESLQAMALLS